MKKKPIQSLEEYEEIAARMEVLQYADAESEEEQELKYLTKLILAFESKRAKAEQH